VIFFVKYLVKEKKGIKFRNKLKKTSMIFRNSTVIPSKKNVEELKNHLLGLHLQIHDLDFEILEHKGDIKIIPHAEIDNHIYTLPITRLQIIATDNGTIIKTLSKPRRIDVGGPLMLVIFVAFSLVAAILLYLFGGESYHSTSYILAGIGVAVMLLLTFRLQQGYYDYVRKINRWIKSHV
jgi:hypothetical protein